ncbi:hypothetical protein MTO96_018913 [Rhipicephalus appendiculatus]
MCEACTGSRYGHKGHADKSGAMAFASRATPPRLGRTPPESVVTREAGRERIRHKPAHSVTLKRCPLFAAKEEHSGSLWALFWDSCVGLAPLPRPAQALRGRRRDTVIQRRQHTAVCVTVLAWPRTRGS